MECRKCGIGLGGVMPSGAYCPRCMMEYQDLSVKQAKCISELEQEVELAHAAILDGQLRNSQLYAALDKYGDHDPDCKRWKVDFTMFRHHDPKEECTCGYEKALEGK